MHKNPSGARFIVASSKCSTKPLSKNISYIFKLIFEQVQNFHLKSKFYGNINCFWVVKNSFSVIEKLDKINKRKGAKCVDCEKMRKNAKELNVNWCEEYKFNEEILVNYTEKGKQVMILDLGAPVSLAGNEWMDQFTFNSF